MCPVDVTVHRHFTAIQHKAHYHIVHNNAMLYCVALQVIGKWGSILHAAEQREYCYKAFTEHVSSGKYKMCLSRGGSHKFKWMGLADQTQLMIDLALFVPADERGDQVLKKLFDNALPHLKKSYPDQL